MPRRGRGGPFPLSRLGKKGPQIDNALLQLLARAIDAGTNVNRTGFDVPRAGTGPTKAAEREALIPDTRNDENLAVAQIHARFINFHNRVIDHSPRIPCRARCSSKRPAVKWCGTTSGCCARTTCRGS